MGVIIYLRSSVFAVRSVSVEGVDNPRLSTELENLKGRSIFSGSITATLDRWLKNDLSLERLSCRRGLPSSLQCQASYRQPALIWRKDGKDYLLDSSGRLYAENQGSVGLVVEDATAIKNGYGEQVISASLIAKMKELSQLLETRKITVNRFQVNDAIYQVDALLSGFETAQGPVSKELRAKFSLTEAIADQVAVLAKLLNDRGASVGTQIDLRVPGYVYYR